MTKRDFLALEDWSADEVEALLALAARVKRGEITGGLERKVLAMVFMDPSLRTRTSFETAMFLHGGHAVVLEPGQGKLVAGDRARRGDGRRHASSTSWTPRGCSAATPTRSACASFPRGRDWSVARRGRDHPELRAALREAGDQPRVGAAPSLPGAGRRDDAAGEAGRDRGQALRADLGLASEGAARRPCPPAPRSPRPGSAWRS